MVSRPEILITPGEIGDLLQRGILRKKHIVLNDTHVDVELDVSIVLTEPEVGLKIANMFRRISDQIQREQEDSNHPTGSTESDEAFVDSFEHLMNQL